MNGSPPTRPTQPGRRRRTCLGRLDPTCTAQFHGTYTAYRYGCRCPHAREDHRLFSKRLRQGRHQPRLVDTTGVTRRIQALWAIGHTCDDIAAATGGTLSANYVANLWRRQTVTIATWNTIAVVYRELSAVPGRSAVTRRRAAAAGYPSPLHWGADIDDPAAVPDRAAAPVDVNTADSVKVRSVLRGEKTVAEMALTSAERAEVLRSGLATGRTLTALAELLRMSTYDARALLAGRVPPRMAQRERVEAALLADGGLVGNVTLARNLGVNRLTVVGARKRLTERGLLLAA